MMATLREAKGLLLAPTTDAEDLYSPQNLAANQAAQIAGASQIGRGWESAGLSGRAGELWTDSLKAQIDGDQQNAAVLASQARDLQQQASAWAPTVQNFSDITGLRSGLDWAGGALGNLRTSVAPALGGLAGAAAGTVLAPLTGGVINPVTAGFAGASLAGYDAGANEAIAQAMNDPDIRAARTPQEILNVGRMKGLGESVLEAIVPTILGGKLVGQGVKKAVGAGFGGAAARIGKEAAVGGATEFATEGAQSLGGQTAQNYLAGRNLTDYDYLQAANEGMAGLVGGKVMSGVGGAADVAYDRLGKGVTRAQEIKADPTQFVADKAIDLSRMAGTAVGKAEPVVKNVFDWMTDSKRRTYDDLTNPNVPDENVDAYAHEWATHVLATQKEHPQADVQAAAEYIRDIAKPGALSTYRLKIEANRNESKMSRMDAGIVDEIDGKTSRTKSSKMQAGRGPLVQDAWEQDLTGENVRLGKNAGTWATFDADRPESTLSVSTPAQPKGETTADIWRKQGVSDKLLAATTEQTDPAQREMAIAVMGWVERGFKDADGNVFVPESLVKKHGKNAGAVIKSAVETAFNNGLVGHDVAKQIPDVVEMAQKQYLDSKSVLDAVAGAIPEYARKKYTASDIDTYIVPMLRHVAKYGLSSDKAEAGRQEAALLDIFGSKEALGQAMSKFPTPTGRNMLAQANAEEDVFDANERGVKRVSQTSDDEADAKYESELTTGGAETRYVGKDKDNNPFDRQIEKDADKLAALEGDRSSGRVSRVVGLWERILDSEQAPADREAAETDLLIQHAKDFLPASRLADMERYGVSIEDAVNEMPPLQRRAILRKIDNRFKMIRLDSMGDAAAPDAIPKGGTTGLREGTSKDPDKDGLTADKGGIFLERESNGRPNARPFPTSAMRLIKHFQKSNEYAEISGEGVQGSYQMVLKSLGALMETEVAHAEAVQAWYDEVSGPNSDASPEVVAKAKAAVEKAKKDGRFTGRVGYKTDLTKPVIWLNRGLGVNKATKTRASHDAIGAQLPEALQIGLRGTIKEVKEVRSAAVASGERKGELVPFETTFMGQKRALTELAARPETSDGFRWVIENTLTRTDDEGNQKPLGPWKREIAEFYQKLRSWDGTGEEYFSSVSNVKAPKRGSRVDSEGASKILRMIAKELTGGVSNADQTMVSRDMPPDVKKQIEDNYRKMPQIEADALRDQALVKYRVGSTPAARKRTIPLAIQEKIAKHRKAGRLEQADKLQDDWTKTFRDVAAWQVANSKDRGSDDNAISVGDLTSDESAMSMTRAEDPSMEGKERSTTPFIPTYPLAYRKLLELKDSAAQELLPGLEKAVALASQKARAVRKAGGTQAEVQSADAAERAALSALNKVALSEDETTVLAELRKGAPAWNASFNRLLETNPAKLSKQEQELVARLRQGTAAWRAKYGTDTRMKGTIERNEEGMAEGLGDSGLSGAFGGGTSTSRGTKPVAWRAKGDKLVDQRTGTALATPGTLLKRTAAVPEGSAVGPYGPRIPEPARAPVSVRTRSANEPAGAPLATAETPDRFTTKIDPVLEARDWAFTKLRKGVPAFAESVKALEKLPKKEHIEKLKLMQKGVDALLTMSPAEIVSDMDRALTEGHGTVILSRAKTVADKLKTLLSEGISDGKDAAVVGYGGRTQRVPEQWAGGVAPAGQGPAVLKGPERGTKSEDRSPGGPVPTGDSAAGAQGKGVTVERRAQITRAMLKAEPDTLFLFGDNDDRRGLGGQAASMRGEPNAVGVRTKAHPTTASNAFWSDSQLAENKRKIDEDLKRAFEHNGKVVIPSAGLGSGLARLDATAPQTFAYLESRLKALEGKSETKVVAAKAPEVVPMNFYDGITFGGVLHRMRPEFKGRSTLDLIKSGDRTATSRRMRPTVAVGDVLAMTNKSGERVLVRVTKAPYKVSDVTPEQWSKLEGWDTSVYGPYKDAWQYQYELADQVARAPAEAKSAAPTTLTAKLAKQLADAKTTVDKKNVLFDELKTLLDNHTERGAFGVRLTNLKDDVKDVASYLEAMSTAEMSLREKLTPAQDKALTEMLTKAYRAFQMAHGKHVVDVLEGTKQSKQAASSQTADDGTGRQLYTEDQITAARKFITDRLGDSVEVEFKPHFGDNSSGSWTPTDTKSIIRLALNGDIFGAAAHESMHEFFNILGKAGSKQTQDILLRTAKNPILLRQVERLLDGHPKAVEQIMTDPEEALAFMYQFWNAGLLKLGPQTKSLFQKIKDYIAKVLGKLSAEELDQIFVDKVFRAFDAGVVSKGSPYAKPALTDGKPRTGPEAMDGSVRDAMLRAFEQNAEAHNKALDAADKYGRNLVKNLGKLGFSAEAMMLATKNKQIEKIMRKFNQEAGTAMQTAGGTSNQAFFPGVHQHMGIYMNRLSNILTAYKPEDLELARKAMASDKVPTDRIAKEIAQKLYALNEDVFKYITSRKVMRRDDDLHTWVPVEHRARYFPQVWNTEAIAKDPNKVAQLLLQHHMKELSAIAAEANKEVTNKTKLKKGNVSRDVQDSGDTTVTITEAMIADAIVARMMQSGGHVEHDETTSDLGISPAATSVNRRSLSWIDPEVFDEFKSKDMTSIMTSYISSMVKRAEYTKHFGPGGETLRDDFDRAVVEELGGDKLLEATNKAFTKALAEYEAERADAVAAGEPFRQKRPSLRAVGISLHTENVGQAKADADVKEAVGALEQAAKAIMAMEGTLGSDISPATRKVVSAITAYQTVRLLPTVLFSSVNDVMGIVAQGGDLKDAWKSLVRGLREVRLRWKDEKSTDTAALRAEEWGTVEAGSHMEVLGQIYGSMYMTGMARKMSNSFFKWNGMEGWNRAMRIEATVVAERALTGLAKHGYDKTDKAAVARVAGLYGENFDTSKIALTPEGRLDTTDAANQAAMMRWVSSAIMTPNAAHRTIWGSDPRMAPFWHLKQFAYTFHRVMLKGAYEQAKLGNFRPAAVLALGYAPVTIAAGAVKEMMIPGEEPPWMQGGLDDYLAYGVSRAGIFGIPGMTYSSVSDDYGVNMLGPTVSQVASVPFDEPVKTGLRAMPLGTLLGRMAPSTP